MVTSTKVPMNLINLMEKVCIFGKMVTFMKDNSGAVIWKAEEDGGLEMETSMRENIKMEWNKAGGSIDIQVENSLRDSFIAAKE